MAENRLRIEIHSENAPVNMTEAFKKTIQYTFALMAFENLNNKFLFVQQKISRKYPI